MAELGLKSDHLFSHGEHTPLGGLLMDYFTYRAKALNEVVRPNLMDKDSAKALFEEVHARLDYKGDIPMNKQKAEKKAPAFLTGLVQMLVSESIGQHPCNFDPRHLTSVTVNGLPIRTLARRVDGAFPSVINPVAIWEIKEYYYTTTFGSRVADGVYETLLDGMELEELQASEKIEVKHYLFLDDRYTWWDCGRSYLCRIVDMMHMGYVDEAIFGREVVTAIPRITKDWLEKLAAKTEPTPPTA